MSKFWKVSKWSAAVVAVLACAIPVADKLSVWLPQGTSFVSNWWSGPPKNASPLCLQIADMLEDSDLWAISGTEQISSANAPLVRIKFDDREGVEVEVANSPDANDLLTHKEKIYLQSKYKVCREGIIDRHRNEVASKLKKGTK